MKKHFFVVAAVIISSQLTAQKDTSSTLLDEVVVTANKFPNKTTLTGKVITVITKEQLEKSGGKDLAQVLAEQAGIYIGGSNSNAGKDKSIYLRGARVDHTLITLDGIPVYDASGIGGNFDIRNLAIENIEKIEILKGSQSTLYGSDAIAGVINIISRKPGNKPINGTGSLNYGSFNTIRGNTGFNGKKDNLDYNISYSLNKTDGINEAAGNTNNPDKDSYSQYNLVAGFGVQATKNIRMQPYLKFTKIKGDIDQGAFTDELDYTFTQKNFQAGVRNEFSFGKTKLDVLYNYNNINREYIDDSVKSRNGYDIYSRGNYKGAGHFIDAYAIIPLNNLLKLTIGSDFRISKTEQEYITVPSYGPPSKLHKEMNQVSLYGALNINTEKGFNLELGNRLNFHSEYGSKDVFNLNPSWLINKKIKLFANFSTAYRTPSLYQLFSEYGNKNLKPESAFTAEGGTQYFSANNKFTGRIVIFNRHVKDAIAFQSNYINQDKQKDHGLEIEAKFTIASKITIRAFYNYVNGEISTKKNGKDTSYFNLLRRPKNSFGINPGCQINSRFYISSNLMSIGKRKDTYFDAMTYQTVNTTLKSYVLWDVYAEYTILNKKLRLFADFRNILNSRYTEASGFNTFGFNGNGGIRFNF